MMNVVHYQRRPNESNHSIERVFESVRAGLDACRVRNRICRFESRGLFRRLYNIVEAALAQGDVNHITGDVHYLALLLHRRRTLLTIHDCVGMVQQSGIRRPLYRWLWLKMPVSRSAVVSVVSEETKRQVLRYTSCTEAKIRVIPDPVGDEFRPAPKCFNSNKPTILQVGAGRNKNLQRVARGLSGIRCKLDIIGRPLPEVEEELRSLGVEYEWAAGLSALDIVTKYQASDLVVFCSTYEGFGMPIIEGNATGRPVVTSDMEPMKTVAGGAACLVDPYDVASIRRGIMRVIEEPEYRDQLVRRGLENARRFSAKVVALSYQSIYNELVGDRAAGASRKEAATASGVRMDSRTTPKS